MRGSGSSVCITTVQICLIYSYIHRIIEYCTVFEKDYIRGTLNNTEVRSIDCTVGMRRIQNFWIRPEPDPPIFMDPVPEPNRILQEENSKIFGSGRNRIQLFSGSGTGTGTDPGTSLLYSPIQ